MKKIEGPITKWRNFVKKANPIEIEGDHILIEDFRVTSNIPMKLKQQEGDEIIEESLIHYIRTERIHATSKEKKLFLLYKTFRYLFY
jgi:hypothetical protein